MILLQVNQVSKSFGADPILTNIKLEVQVKDRIAIVGKNGAGKSTLLKIITEQISYDTGQIIKPNHCTIGYLAQDHGLDSNQSIWAEMTGIFTHLQQMEKRLRSLEEKMGDPDVLANEKEYEKLLNDYDNLQLTFKEQGGYQYEADIRGVLHGLQFSDFDYQTPIHTLSGGQKTRLSLGKLLLQKPDLLILDEPTNHLDIETMTWLEQYLQNYDGALLLVSHDRYFLDRIVTQIYEISRTNSKKFVGNYSAYIKQKAEIFERELKEFEKQQKEVAKIEDFIQKNIARASTTKRAQSRRKQLDRMDFQARPLGDSKAASFSFDIKEQSGNEVLNVSNLTFSYPNEKPILENLNFNIKKGDSIALIGENGIGKSTLLKAINQQMEINFGDIHYGSKVQIGYYDQEQANLNSNKTVLNELWDDYPLTNEKDIRSILGNFLFSGDDVLKIVSDLSGGEKARLALSKLMMKKANFLILDEPTNHLDLDSKAVLENALIDFPGTILFVSHDRYFINRIASRVIELTKNGLTNYLGDYDYYIEKKAETEEIERLEQANKREEKVEDTSNKGKYEQDKETKKIERKRQRRIEEIEAAISEIEEKIAHIEAELCKPEVFQDFEQSATYNSELEQHNKTLEELMEEWESLH